MPRGSPVASQIARKWIAPLLAPAAIAVVFLSHAAANLETIAAGVNRQLESPWLRPGLCGAGGLLLFLLLSMILRITDHAALSPANSAASKPVEDLAGSAEHQVRTAAASSSAPVNPPCSAAPIAPSAPPSPFADLKNASPRDSRFRTRAHFSGQKRRASDYSGPLRRATDRHTGRNYSGPLRRASDKQNPVSQLNESSERRLSDRRSATTQDVQPLSEEARQHRIPPTRGCLKPAPEQNCDVLPISNPRDTSNMTAQHVQRN